MRFASKHIIICCLTLGVFSPAIAQKVSVKNPTQYDWKEVVVVCPLDDKQAPKSLSVSGELIYCQADDLDGDKQPDEIAFLSALKAGETKVFEFSDEQTTAPESRAHTAMYLKNDDIKGFEGPGWESDIIGFRIYWDARNATDIFGKTKPGLSLANLAQKGVNYHRLSAWGMDVLKVKTAVGIGGFGAWHNGKVEKLTTATREFIVRSDGPIRAICDLNYTDWKFGDRTLDLRARMSIGAGQSWADCELKAVAKDGKPLPELIGGFVKHEEQTVEVTDEEAGYVGRWGRQALGEGEVLNGGDLGMAIMAQTDALSGFGEDEVNHFLRLKTDPQGTVTFRYLADWFKQPDASLNAEDFRARIIRTQAARPVVTLQD